MKVLFVLVSVVVAVVMADITGTPVKAGDTVCANTAVKARDHAGLNGNVVATLSAGDCAQIYGGILTKDGYKWYEVKYNGQRVWCAGKYLDKSSSTGGASCGASRKAKACKILGFHNSGKLELAKSHPSGVNDNAFAYNNIRDMCNGKKASVSKYSCNVCPTGTPGGYTCLTNNLLDYMIKLAGNGWYHVTELAGACHSCKSRHYRGQAIDVPHDGRYKEYMSTCTAMGGWALDEHNHIHCQFYD